jgi:hypothetical protein
MSNVEEIELTSDIFLNKSTVLYGVTKSGKSKVIRNILKELNKDVTQVIVICPSDPATGEYSGDKLIATPCIHYEFNIELLKEIFERNEIMASIYTKANDTKLLLEILQRMDIYKNLQPYLERMNDLKRKNIQHVNDRYLVDVSKQLSEIKKINEEFETTTRKLYKTFIRKYKHIIDADKLSQDCRYCIKYLDFNPAMVMIWDDCGSTLQALQKKDKQVVNDYFIRNRHAMITTIVAVQGDKQIHKDLRSNAFNSVFTDPVTARTFFEYRENNIDSELKKYALQAISNHLPNDGVNFEKLLYIREERTFYRFTAKIFTGLRIGSKSLLEYCERVKNKENGLDRNNKFYRLFSLESKNS